MTARKIPESEDLYRQIKANQQIFGVLEASKALTEGIFDELPVVLIMIHSDGRILKMNKIGESIFGKPEMELLGTSSFEILPASVAKEVRNYLSKGMDTVTERLALEEEVCMGGKQVYLHWQVCPVYYDKRSHPKVFAIIGNDTTEARAALETLVAFKKDVEVAGAVQSMILPHKDHIIGSFYELAAYYEPAATVGGDLWWHCQLTEDHFLLVVADVTGHGIGSAMVTANLGGIMDAQINALSSPADFNMESFLKRANQSLYRSCEGRFSVCLTMISMHRHSEDVEVFSFGFPPAFHFRKGQDPVTVLVQGNPLGSGEMFCKSKTIKVQAGDRLVFATDGCYEFATKDRKQLGRNRLLKLLAKEVDSSPANAKDTIGIKLKTLRTSDLADDDVTFVVLDRR